VKLTLNEKASTVWIDNFVEKWKSELFETESFSQDKMRLEVPQAFLTKTINCTKDHVVSLLAELVSHFDKIGVSEWAECIAKPVIVLMENVRKQVDHH
jgi:hypothetical protein